MHQATWQRSCLLPASRCLLNIAIDDFVFPRIEGSGVFAVFGNDFTSHQALRLYKVNCSSMQLHSTNVYHKFSHSRIYSSGICKCSLTTDTEWGCTYILTASAACSALSFAWRRMEPLYTCTGSTWLETRKNDARERF